MSELTNFEKLYTLDVNHKVAKKNGLNYLSWAYGWAEFKKIHPEATYKIIKHPETHLPYFYDDKTGYTVFTEVTAGGVTHEMWLFAMDGSNKAMKHQEYTYKVKAGDRFVQPATMFDINKTLMRCLVKNLAMFGLGLYIYEKESFPEQIIEEPDLISCEQVDILDDLIAKTESDLIKFLAVLKVNKLSDLYLSNFDNANNMLNRKLDKMEKNNAK